MLAKPARASSPPSRWAPTASSWSAPSRCRSTGSWRPSCAGAATSRSGCSPRSAGREGELHRVEAKPFALSGPSREVWDAAHGRAGSPRPTVTAGLRTRPQRSQQSSRSPPVVELDPVDQRSSPAAPRPPSPQNMVSRVPAGRRLEPGQQRARRRPRGRGWARTGRAARPARPPPRRTGRRRGRPGSAGAAPVRRSPTHELGAVEAEPAGRVAGHLRPGRGAARSR